VNNRDGKTSAVALVTKTIKIFHTSPGSSLTEWTIPLDSSDQWCYLPSYGVSCLYVGFGDFAPRM